MSQFHNRVHSCLFQKQLGKVCSEFAAQETQLPPLRSFDFHAFTAFDRSYCTLTTPRESLDVSYSLVLAFALSEPLMASPGELLENKRRQFPQVIEEAEELVASLFQTARHFQFAMEAIEKELPILVLLAQYMSWAALTALPLDSGPVPKPYFSFTAAVTFATGLQLRRVHPSIAADLAEEFNSFRLASIAQEAQS